MFRPQTRLDMFQLLVSDICFLLPQTWVEIVPRSPFKISSSFTLTDAGCSHRLGNHILQKKKKKSHAHHSFIGRCVEWQSADSEITKEKQKQNKVSQPQCQSKCQQCKLRIWWNFRFLFFILPSILHTVDPLVRIVVQVTVETVDLCKDCLNLYSLTFTGVPLASCVISCFLSGVR